MQSADGVQEQLWVSMNLCRDFREGINGFFERIFKATGLPNRHLQIED